MTAGAVSATQTLPLASTAIQRFALSRVAVTVTFIVALTTIAFGLRVAGLSTYGLSEDEINKVRAIEQYRQGHFTANAEHPMLMKLAMLTSTELSSAWNRIAPAGRSIGGETALRLPNVAIGAATTVAIFALCQLLFGTSVAAIASLFWALDVNVIAINRIGKEDTFALFFFVLAVWCYERAKWQGVSDPSGAQRWYTSSGISFGLMLASKYFVHYLGVYAVFNHLTDRNPGPNRPNQRWYFGAMALAFLLADFTVLNPATWHYCLEYVQGATLMHHGHLYAGQVYANTSLLSANGIPASFYLRALATKVPVVVLGGVVAGLIEATRRRCERGFALLNVWFALFLIGHSLAAGKFLRYGLPLFTAIDIFAAIGVVAGIRWLLRKRWLPPVTRATVSAATLAVCVAGPFLALQSARPYYSLFRNAIGERVAPSGATFTEETYEYGVREAIQSIARIAEPGAIIVSDAPGTVAYYVEHSQRRDLRVRSLSAEGLAPAHSSSFVIVQNEHVSFENRNAIADLRRSLTPWREFYAGDALAAQVFRIPRS